MASVGMQRIERIGIAKCPMTQMSICQWRRNDSTDDATYRTIRLCWTRREFAFNPRKVPVYEQPCTGGRVDQNISNADVAMQDLCKFPSLRMSLYNVVKTQ